MIKVCKNLECSKPFTTKKDTVSYCSHDCLIAYIRSDEFDMELNEVLGFKTTTNDEKGDNI